MGVQTGRIPVSRTQSRGRRWQSGGVNGGAGVLPKLLIPTKTQIGHSFSFSSSSSPDVSALSPRAKEMISDCCLSKGRSRSNPAHRLIQLWRHCGKFMCIQRFSSVSYQHISQPLIVNWHNIKRSLRHKTRFYFENTTTIFTYFTRMRTNEPGHIKGRFTY